MADTPRDPVNALGELIEDAVIRYSGQIGTLASAHVAEEVVARLRSDPALAASVLGGHVEWGVVVAGMTVPPLTEEQARAWASEYGTVNRRVLGPWVEEGK